MRAWISALLLLGGCSSNAMAPPSNIITIPDPAAYMVMSRCANGQPAVLNPGCPAKPQQAADPMMVRRYDWARPESGQIEDSFVAADGKRYVNTFSYPPHQEFVAANGDGGDVSVIDPNQNIRIDYTQNGTGNGGTIAGWWVGPKCQGGDGWFVFDTRSPSGRWADKVAQLKGAFDPNACPVPLDKSYTRWRQETAPVPFQVNGQRVSDVNLSVVVSEHYDSGALSSAHALERTISAAGYGRVVWEAYTKTPNNFATNCPGVMPWSGPPGAGWYLNDRRCLTNVVSADGSMTGVRYGWPPP